MKFKEKPLRKLTDELPSINDRIEYIRCYFGYPIGPFARKLGVKPVAVLTVVEKDKLPSSRLLKNLSELFPINIAWLYTGNGKYFTQKDLDLYMYAETARGTRPKTEDDIQEAIQFGERVREVRMETGMNQPVFASTVEESPDVIMKIETGASRPSFVFLKKFIVTYKLDPTWALWGIGSKYKNGKAH